MNLNRGWVRWTVAAVLFFGVVAFLLPGAMQAVDEPALIGWWKFDDGGGTTAADSGGLENDGELVGGAAFTSDGLVGGAVNFLGTENDHVEVAWDPSLEPETGTFQAWIKVSERQDADIVKKTTDRTVRSDPTEFGSFSVYGLRMTYNRGIFAFIMNDDNITGAKWTFLGSPDDLITLDTWHHVAMRWDGTMFSIFVDGVRQAEAYYFAIPDIGLSYSGSSPFLLGSPTAGPHSGNFKGQMDDVRFFGWARSDKEIYKDFNTSGLKPPKLKDKEK